MLDEGNENFMLLAETDFLDENKNLSGVKNIELGMTYLKSQNININEISETLYSYEEKMKGCKSSQEVIDETLNFIKKSIETPQICIRSSENSSSLHFKSVSCHIAKQEARVFYLNDKTIITQAARERVSIKLGNQSNSPLDESERGDTGSILTVTLPESNIVKSNKLFKKNSIFQITCCNQKNNDFFSMQDAVLINNILSKMTDLYYARRYDEILPRINKIAESTHESFLYFGFPLHENEFGEKINAVFEKVFLSAADAIYLLVDNGSILENCYPTSLYVHGDHYPSPQLGKRKRVGQRKAVELLKKNNAPIIITLEENGSLVRAKCYVEGAETEDKSCPNTSMVTKELTAIAVPLFVEERLLGVIWYEIQKKIIFDKEKVNFLCQETNNQIRVSDKVHVTYRDNFFVNIRDEMGRCVLDSIQESIEYPQLPILILCAPGTGSMLVVRIIHLETTDCGVFTPIYIEGKDTKKLEGILLQYEKNTVIKDQRKINTIVVFVYDLKILIPFGNRIKLITRDNQDTRFILVCRDMSCDTPGISNETFKNSSNFEEFKIIQLPTLMDQIHNIDSIAEQLLKSLGKGKHFGDEAIFRAFRNHKWTEHFSELKKVISQMCKNSEKESILTINHLPKILKSYVFRNILGSNKMNNPKKIFFCYSKEDDRYKKDLLKHLSSLRDSIVTWNDDDILPGEEWDDRIKHELYKADIVIYLVTANSISTRYINDVELPTIEERCKSNQCILVPIVVNFCDWENQGFAKYNVLPKKGIPVKNSNKWMNEDEAWTFAVKELGRIIKP